MEYTQKNMLNSERGALKGVGTTRLMWAAGAAVLVLLGAYMLMGKGTTGALQVAKDGKLTPAQTTVIKDNVGKLIVPPQEEPVMAVVTSADSLIKEQAFYAGVENGDVLLIYPQAGKAILYSSKRNRLLNVGPVQVGNDRRAAPTATAPAAEATETTPVPKK